MTAKAERERRGTPDGDRRHAGPSARSAHPGSRGAFIGQLVAMPPEALEEYLTRVPGPTANADERPGGASPCWSAPTNSSRRSTRCRPTTWDWPCRATCCSTRRHEQKFGKALAAWQERPTSATRDRLLDMSLAVLEQLQSIVLEPKPSAAVENIYQKRHIAAGIPSMYGNYSEPKFDALGLSFRVENLVLVCSRIWSRRAPTPT